MISHGKIKPVIQIDTREQRPLVVSDYETERVTLPVGDYGIRGFSDWSNPAFILERKSLDDLVNSLTQERFFREIEKLRAFYFAGLLIEGLRDQVEMHQYRSLIHPNAALARIDAIEVRCRIHVIWAGSSAGAAARLCGYARQFARGIEKDYQRLVQNELDPIGAAHATA